MKTYCISIKVFIYLFAVWTTVCSVNGQQKADTLEAQPLRVVEVSAAGQPKNKATSPLQILQEKDLKKLNALQVSDAARFFSGVQIKDYGGIGGLKTVSIRSLGANYTGVVYDGLPISNYQTGQTDIGCFSLENIGQLSLQIGESDDIFQTARRQAYAGVLSISRKDPLSDSRQNQQVSASLKTGSWGLLNPAFLYEQRLSHSFTASVSGEWMKTEGDYPYRSGSGEEKRRLHSGVDTKNMEVNVAGKLAKGGKLSAKIYGYDSDRALPGPDIYYVDSRGEAAREQRTFSQVSYEQEFSSKWKFRALAKYDFSQSDYTHYHSSYPSGEKSYHYRQQEYYLGTVLLHQFSPAWSASWANDGSYASFRNSFSGVKPDRAIWQSALSVRYSLPRLTATASLLSHFAHDIRESGPGTQTDNLHRWSPYIGTSVQVFRTLPLRLRAFYKHTFRQISLGDLYFMPVPPPSLNSETARQLNAGLSWVNAPADWLPYLSVSADVYRNKIDDKIWAIPRSSLYIWSIQNVDVDIKGIDVQATAHFFSGHPFSWQAGGSYTWQKVLDVTKPDSDMYRHQTMYSPEHSASAFLQFSTPWVDLHYTLLYSGSRYFERLNRKEYRMDPYTDQSIALSRTVALHRMKLNLRAECLNITDSRYDIVRSYPMPGRSFRLGIKLSY